MAFHVPAALAAVAGLLAVSWVRAGDMCPAPPKHTSKLATETHIVDDDHRIHLDSDAAVIGADGHAELSGRVRVNQDARSVSADSVTYDAKSGKIAVTGKVAFEDPALRVRSDTGTYDTLGGANFDRANFEVFDRNGRGFAREIAVDPGGKIELAQVRYTTCPVGNQDWMLQASTITLDTNSQQGVGHHVTLRFKDVPVFYTPYISFPMGDDRKSGFLFPGIGHSTKNGVQLQAPYYLNLAPNYDLTLTPGILSTRGVQLDTEFRYLTASSRGRIEANFLPSDRIEHSNRDYLHIMDTTDLKRGLRFDADVASVSDSNYFQDFAVGSEQTSVTYLERRADILYYDDVWRIRAQLQNFQTIDTAVDPGERPYSRVPRIQVAGLYPVLNSRFEAAVDAEATNFLRKFGTTGVRFDFSPELRWSNRGPGYFFEPAFGYHFTQYDLQTAAPGNSSTPTRALPYARLDAGLVFERDAGSAGQRTQTLEPRMVYSYVPYRNQDELPNFDTGLPDLNLTELFRTNRFVGNDRISDADQMAVGLTTRLFDHISGAQYLSATIGQIRYFSIPRVELPFNTLLASAQSPAILPPQNPFALPGRIIASLPQQYSLGSPGQYSLAVPRRTSAVLATRAPGAFPASDIVAEVSLTAYKNVSFNLNYQWNPYTSQTDKSEIAVQYHPDPARVVNIGYRFQQDILKQWDGSFAWPIAGHWNTVGRWVYSIQDRQTIEQVAGFEYKSCCWRVQIVQRRYVSNRTGGLDTSIALQLELTGLSSVGKAADAFLEQEIRGYSTRDPNTPL